MKCLLFLTCACFIVAVQGLNFISIDSFATPRPPLIFTIFVDGGPYAWYSPYGGASNPPTVRFQTTTDCLGGHRDLILGHTTDTPAGSTAVISLVSRRATVAFPLNYVGGAYFQWDGNDQDPEDGQGGSTFELAFPGATLNTFPGIGSDPQIPEADGQYVDFTSSGRATAITITINSDLPVNYFLDAIDANDEVTEIFWIHSDTTSDITYTHRFNDFTCEGTGNDQFCWSNPAFNWARVAAFQVRVLTFRTGAAESIDTSFFSLTTRGYIIPGEVYIDCSCDSSADTFVQNEVVTLAFSSSPSTILQTTQTDSSGRFQFAGLDEGTYRVCLQNINQDFCSPQNGLVNGCRTVTLANLVDAVDQVFRISQVSALVAPPDRTIECGACIEATNACTGFATATLCGGGSQPVTTFTDVVTNAGGCSETITRTFQDQGQTATQIIVREDTFAPALDTPASSASRTCDDTGSESYSAWLNRRAGATWTDCTAMTFSNNAGNRQPGNCGSVDVIFTAADACGAQSTSAATYSVTDFSSPTFTTPPADDSADCDANGGSDFAQFNSWLASNAGAVASDNCGSATITNNFSGQPQRGCSASNVVTFTATDNCGNSDSAQANFVISDNSAPVLSAPSSPTAECNSQTQTSFTTWLNSNGGATATDDCGSATITNDNNGQSAPFGCDDSRVITFTATDSCGRTSQRTATYRVRDSVAPTLTSEASPLNVDCDTATGNELTVWRNDAGGARATDACAGPLSFTDDFNTLSGDCTQVPVTFTACDGCGNCVSSTANYSIVDTDAPVFTTPPQPLTVECGSDTQTAYTAWLSTDANAVISDNCASPNELTLSNDGPTNAPSAPSGSQCSNFVNVNFVARDPCGNSTPQVSARFTVTDSFAPIISPFPSDSSVACSSSNNSEYVAWRNDRGGARATDTCTSVTWSNNGPNSFVLTNGDCADSVSVIFTASDACGNFATATGSFSIVDNVAPVINPTASDSSAECATSGVDAWLNNNGGARATDACSGVTFSNNFSGFTGGCTETAFVTFTATDACGNQADTSATYSIVDTTSPVINPRAQPRTVPCDNNTGNELSAWLNDNGGARATDACQPDNTLTWSNNFGNGDVVGCDFATVTFTVTDACGQTASTTSTFTSEDESPPTFSPAAQDRTVECNGSGNVGDYENFVNTRAGAVAIDACALSFVWTNNAPAAGPTTCRSQSVTFTVEDECGNSARTTAVYTVADTIAPSINVLPSDRNVECDGLGNTSNKNDWISSNGGATATDVCASTVTFAQTRTDTTGDSCSTTDVYTFTASDNCGNSSSATARYTIRDFTAPTITVEPSDATFECDGNGNIGQITSWVNDNAGARASDVCQGQVTWTNDFAGNGLFTCTSLFVNFQVSDGCGNTVSRSATVAVEDTIDPVFSFFPADVTIPCDADASTDVLGFAESQDACAGDIIVNMSEVQFDEPPVGDCPGDKIITRTFSAFDECGNSIVRDQVITVVIERSSGPCDPEGCECDGCCPPAEASDCIAVDCQAVACRSSPCEASLCTCDLSGSTSKSLNKVDMNDLDLPLCKPVYIYVNDDDDTMTDDSTGVTKNRMFVTNEPIHELKSKSF